MSTQNPSEISQDNSIVKITDLEELSRGNKNFIREMITLFMEQNPRDVNEIETALGNTNYDKIRATAHRMKTSVGFMGMPTLAEPLNTIEMLAENKTNPEQINTLFALVKHDCDRAMQELNHILTNLEKEKI